MPSPPTLRAFTSAYANSTTINIAVPATVQAGDTMVLFTCGTTSPNSQTGWDTLEYRTTGAVTGYLVSKTATSASAGSTVQVKYATATNAEVFLFVVAGPQEFAAVTVRSTTASTATLTGLGPAYRDALLVYVGSCRVGGATVTTSSGTVDATRAADTGVSGVLAHETFAMDAAIPNVTFTPSATGTGYYFAAINFQGINAGSQGSSSRSVALGPLTASDGDEASVVVGDVVEADPTEGPLVDDPPADAEPFPPDPDPGPVPLSSGPLTMWRTSRTYAAPTLVGGVPDDWTPTSEVVEPWGSWRVYAGGTDITMFRGAPVEIAWQLAEPFGCGPATLIVPALRTFDTTGVGSLAWLKPGTNITVAQVLPGSTTTRGKWWGVVAAQEPELDESSDTYRVSLLGAAWLADLQTHKAKTYMSPTDIGSVIPAALNSVVSRRTPKIATVVTGILTNQRGSSDQSELEYAQGLLATATTDDGSSQWTVGRPSSTSQALAVRLKNRTTQNWSLRAGQPGARISLTKDPTQSPNRIYGRGVNTDGYSWGNWVYPNARPDAAPPYPFSSAGTVMTIGTTDADTSSGDGVSVWQDRSNDLNLTADLRIDGVYNSNDAEACRVIQRHFGLTVDGVVGPQTWAATFDVGANGTDLGSAFRLPLAWNPKVMPRLFNADGSDAGANPAYDSTIIVVDRDENFGSGITKTQARRSARAELARDTNPGWLGTITLTADPPEGSRWDIYEGQNIRINGHHGENPLLHIAAVDVNPFDGAVTLTVDEKARDLVTIGGILSRDRSSKEDPARLPTRRLRRSLLHSDSIVEYDGESAGGVIPKHALFGGLWTVIRVPVSQAGRVAKLSIRTTSPATKFCIAFFGDAVLPSDLVSHVGSNPLADRTDGYGPFDWDADTLIDLGFIEAFGGPGQAAGYDPGYETSPHTGTATPVTGKLISSSSFEYRSAKPPWLWIAEYAPVSCFISGRILPGPVDY